MGGPCYSKGRLYCRLAQNAHCVPKIQLRCRRRKWIAPNPFVRATVYHLRPTTIPPIVPGSSSSYEGLKNAFGILNENLLLNLSDTGVSPAKLAVVCLIAAVLAVDVAVLWLISRNTIAEARAFFRDNFYFKRIRLVYPTPAPRQNTPKQRLRQLFQDIREEHKQKQLQADYDYGSSPYGLDYDGTASAGSAPEYTGSGGEDNKLFGKLFPTAPDYDYIEDKQENNSLFGKIFSSKPAKAKPSWSPVSGPSGSGGGSGTGPPSLPSSPSFYRPSSSPSFSTTEKPPPARKAKSIAEQAVDSLSKAGNHLFRKVTSYASSAASSAPAAPDHDYASSATAYASSASAPDYGQGYSGSGGATSATASAPDYGYFGSVLDGGRSVLDKLSTATR